MCAAKSTSARDQNSQDQVELDARYKVVRTLAKSGTRATYLCVDVLTDQEVVVKTDELTRILRELTVMLQLPTGVGPAVLDAVWKGNGTLLLVMELVPGRTLAEAAPEIPKETIPAVVAAIATKLQHLHDAGFIHLDLKPSNIMVELPEGAQGGDGDEAAEVWPNVRLLDLGTAWTDTIPIEGGLDSVLGTEGFVAPEVHKRWSFDHRADLFSLGRCATTCFPNETQHPVGQLFAKLERSQPSQRIQSGRELCRLLPYSRSLESRTFPLFCGPFRFRDNDISRLERSLDRHREVVAHGRRGVGLTRLLVECVSRRASGGKPAVRALDTVLLPSTTRTQDRIGSLLDQGESILWGIPDVAPGFDSPGTEVAEYFRSLLQSTPTSSRVRVDSLRESQVVEFFESVPEIPKPLVQSVSSKAWRWSDGNIPSMRRALSAIAEPSETNKTGWSFDPERLHRLEGVAAAPRFSATDDDLALASGILAYVGETLTATVAEAVLKEFSDTQLGSLVRSGIVIVDLPDGENSGQDSAYVRFTSGHYRSLALDALTAKSLPKLFLAIDRLVHTIDTPRLGDVDALLQSVARADRLRDEQSVRRLLAEAFELNCQENNWHAILRILGISLSHGSKPIDTASLAIAKASDFYSRVGPRVSSDRILRAAGEAVARQDAAAGKLVLARVAEQGGPEDRYLALRWLAQFGLNGDDPKLFEKSTNAIRSMENVGECEPGLATLMQARAFLRSGSLTEAAPLLAALAQSRPDDPLVWNSIATLRWFQDQKEEAIQGLRHAISVSESPAERAIYRFNLGMMVGAAAESQDSTSWQASTLEFQRAAQDAEAIGSKILKVRAQLQHGWMLARGDRIGAAEKMVRDVIAHSSSYLDHTRRLHSRRLLAFCSLHRGQHEHALYLLSSSLHRLNTSTPPATASKVVEDVLEALIVTGFNPGQALVDDVSAALQTDDDYSVVARGRTLSLAEMYAGEPGSALDTLLELEPIAGRVPNARTRSGLLMQIGLTRLVGRRDLRSACSAFADVANQYRGGHSLRRSFCILQRARAFLELGRRQDGLRDVDRALSVARASGCSWIVFQAIALRNRAMATDSETK